MGWVTIGFCMAAAVAPLRLNAQDSLPGSRISNAGVARAAAATDSVYVSRARQIDTVDIGDFTSYLVARIGAPPFDDSLAFRVTADSVRVRVSGRLRDFPADIRSELGPIFSFLDSNSVFVAEVSMPQAEQGIMVFRLERITVRGFAIPDLLVAAALERYREQYPKMLTAGGREFHVQIPLDGRAKLVDNAIVLRTARSP